MSLSIFKEESEIIDSPHERGLKEKDLIILKEISKGLSNKEIADKLFVSDRTIEYRLTKIYKNLGVKSRGEAIRNAISLNLLEL